MQVEEWLNKYLEKVKGTDSADPYYYGIREGCTELINWLIQQGVIKQ